MCIASASNTYGCEFYINDPQSAQQLRSAGPESLAVHKHSAHHSYTKRCDVHDTLQQRLHPLAALTAYTRVLTPSSKQWWYQQLGRHASRSPWHHGRVHPAALGGAGQEHQGRRGCGASIRRWRRGRLCRRWHGLLMGQSRHRQDGRCCWWTRRTGGSGRAQA